MKRLQKPLILLIIVFALFASCKNEQKEWVKINQTNNIEEIEDFLKDFPKSEYLNEAKELLFYSKLIKDTVISNFEEFIKQYPHSKKLNEIKAHLNELKSDSAFYVAVKSNTIQGFDNFIQEFPISKKNNFAKEKLRYLIIKDLVPDWIVIMNGQLVIDDNWYDNQKNKKNITAKDVPLDKLYPGGTYYGNNSQYSMDMNTGSLEWIRPNPKNQKIILVILDVGFDSIHIPNELKINKAYFWRNGKDYIFIKDINPKLETDSLLKNLGLNGYGIPRYEKVPITLIKE